MWDRRRKESLQQLQARSKWLHPNRAFEVGDIVISKDEIMPLLEWPLARIKHLYVGPDGLSRVALLKTQKTELKRAISRLIYLPLNDAAAARFMQILTAMAGGLEP